MLIAFHKPYDVLSQFTREADGQRTLAEFGLPKGVYPVGRLDRDSEGLLLLSDEPKLIAAILEPDAHTAKTYFVQVEGTPTEAMLALLSKGIEIGLKGKTYKTRPAKVVEIRDPGFGERQPPIRVRKTVPDAWLQLTITEGKNRQVRKMCAAAGLPVLRLIRTATGKFQLGDLAVGKWQPVDRRKSEMTPKA